MKNLIIPAMLLTAASAVLFPSCDKKKEAMTESVPEIVVDTAVTDSVVIRKEFPALLESASAVDVVAQTSGQILQKHFKDGDYVEKGALLYSIESRELQAEVIQARAAIDQARSQLEYYTSQCEAMNKALQADAVAKITVDQAESNRKAAAATLASAQGRLESAQTALSHCSVTAPISGRTGNAVQQGTYASEGSTLVSIVDNSDLKVTFSVDDSQFRQLEEIGLKDGTRSPLFESVPVNFENAGTFMTRLYYVSPSVDSGTGTITLQGRIEDPDGLLRDGMYATVNLPVSTMPHATLVNDASIGTDLQGAYLYVVNDSNRVVYTPVTTGDCVNDTLRVINSGIRPGERYVKSALLTVRNGMEVKPVTKL